MNRAARGDAFVARAADHFPGNVEFITDMLVHGSGHGGPEFKFAETGLPRQTHQFFVGNVDHFGGLFEERHFTFAFDHARPCDGVISRDQFGVG